MQLGDVRGDDDEEVGAIARLRQRGHEPSRRLQDAEVAELAFRQGVIDDAAGPLSQGHHRPHAFDLGPEPTEQGQAGIRDQARCLCNRFRQADRLPPDRRRRPGNGALKPSHRAFAAVFQDLEALGRALDREVVAQDSAEGTGHAFGRPGGQRGRVVGQAHGGAGLVLSSEAHKSMDDPPTQHHR